ncbi:MAG: tetratricopeptide repeat protein, partial [Muribaculaceae bacterium]|nr:tetratricopeptide repeat protein [Muribaculaceae bacterium]
AARLIDAMAVEPNNPGNLLLMTNLGMVYSCLDRDSLAIATLDEVNRRAPNMSVALLNRGRIKLKLNKNDEALDDFNKVISIDSLNADARYFRGMMALYGGDKETAESDLNVIKNSQPERVRTLAALGALYSMTGRNKEAIKYFEKLIEKEPSPEYFANLAGCYLAVENLTEASRVISEGLKLYSHDPELYYYRAWLNRDRFRLDDAHDDARLAIKYGASQKKVNDLFNRK